MSDETEKKWDFVTQHLAKRGEQLPQHASEVLVSPIVQTDEQPQKPRGIVERFKAGAIDRNRRIELLTENTKGQLAVWKHFVEGQVVVAKQRIDAHVEGQLMEIGRQHLTNLQEIG